MSKAALHPPFSHFKGDGSALSHLTETYPLADSADSQKLIISVQTPTSAKRPTAVPQAHPLQLWRDFGSASARPSNCSTTPWRPLNRTGMSPWRRWIPPAWRPGTSAGISCRRDARNSSISAKSGTAGGGPNWPLPVIAVTMRSFRPSRHAAPAWMSTSSAKYSSPPRRRSAWTVCWPMPVTTAKAIIAMHASVTTLIRSSPPSSAGQRPNYPLVSTGVKCGPDSTDNATASAGKWRPPSA